MKRKLFSVCLSLLSLAAIASSYGVNALMIHDRSGKNVTILFDEKPVVRFKGNDLVVTTPMNAVIYYSADAVKFSYVSVDPNDVSIPRLLGAVFSFDKGSVRMQNLPPYARVSIYTVDGKQISSSMTDSKGCGSLELPASATSVYIIKTPSSTFKISRP